MPTWQLIAIVGTEMRGIVSMGGVVAREDVGSEKSSPADVTRRRGGSGPTVLSVIGPVEGQVQEVVSGLRARLPGHRILGGVGPDIADGVVAVATADKEDADILLAVRNAMGGCIFYTDSGTSEAESVVGLRQEPGITTVQWQAGVSSTMDLDRLADVVESLWVDIPRWVSDARRADADRIDRVRVAIRLTAERYATELLGLELLGSDAATPSGRAVLSELFRARVRCLVLEHGVEWPHLAEMPAISARSSAPDTRDTGADIGDGERYRGNRMRFIFVLAMSCGAGAAVAVAVSRLVGPFGGVLSGLAVSGAMAAIRWRMFAGVRRAQCRERGGVLLRRQWNADVAEVVARVRIPSVAEAIVQEIKA